jgi:hypothetical protein
VAERVQQGERENMLLREKREGGVSCKMRGKERGVGGRDKEKERIPGWNFQHCNSTERGREREIDFNEEIYSLQKSEPQSAHMHT